MTGKLPLTIPDLTLDQRAHAADIVSRICSERQYTNPEVCHLVWAAKESWGTRTADNRDEEVRVHMYGIMRWCHRHKTQILHHIAWRDSNSLSNVYKTICVHGKFPDYSYESGVEFYNMEETQLLQRRKLEKIRRAKLRCKGWKKKKEVANRSYDDN